MNIVYIRLSFCVKWIITFKKNKRENLSASFWSVGDHSALYLYKKNKLTKNKKKRFNNNGVKVS